MVEALANGTALGAAYALLGLGFTLSFGVMRRLNLAFGPTILVGVYAGSLVSIARPGSMLLPLLATLGASLAAGLYVERLCFAPLRSAPPYVSMVSTFAVWMQLQEIVSLAAPSRTMPFPAIVQVPGLAFGDVRLPGELLLMGVGAGLLTAALFAIIFRTTYGRAVRALSDDAEAASLTGVDVGRQSTGAFLLASLVGAAAGVLIAIWQRQVSPHFGLWTTVKGLTAMMLGGPGSIKGAAIGGLILGLCETAALWFVGGQYRDGAAFGLLLAAVVWRSRGSAWG